MADGSTLIAFSEYESRWSVDLRSITSRCKPNDQFGPGGRAAITMSIRPPPVDPDDFLQDRGLRVNAVASRREGGAILVGSNGDTSVVGAITSRGRLDEGFGDGGWVVLPFHDDAYAAVEEPSGRIIVGGSSGSGCCVRNWVTAVSARGDVDKSFGTRGRANLPSGGESGISALAVARNGNILMTGGYGNNGCWGSSVAMLTPSGGPVPGFRARLDRFTQSLGFGAFVGDAYVDDEGFTLAGAGQKPCADGHTPASPTGVLAHFRADGELADLPTRFPSRMYGTVQPFQSGQDTVAVGTPYVNASRLTLTGLQASGAADLGFGRLGRASIRTPWKVDKYGIGPEVSVLQGTPSTITVIATQEDHDELQLIRVRL